MLKSFFIASTGQNIGKTTLSLGLLSGLQKRGIKVSYMKPVGQQVEESKLGVLVDKDALLIKEHFDLKGRDQCMSPVLIPRGFTKDFLDQKIPTQPLIEAICSSFKELQQNQTSLIVEGTGHMGVGSIIELNNAQVAKTLNLPILLIASGGLGSAFDELMLNKALCDLYGVPVLGVILNRVRPDKKEMITSYIQKALNRWKVPLLGCIPVDPILSIPSMYDLTKNLFQAPFLSGEEKKLNHFKQIRLAAASASFFRETIEPNQLIVTPAHREDIILAILGKYWELGVLQQGRDLNMGMILTGELPPRHFIVEELKKAHIPAFYVPMQSDEALEKINSFTAKIQKEDKEKIEEAISVVEANVDFDTLIRLLSP